MTNTLKMRNNNKPKLFNIINGTLLILFSLITIYPMFYVLIGAFSHGDAYSAGGAWLFPRQFTLSNFIVILSDDMLWYAFRNTIMKTVIGTGLSLIFTSIVAYAMSRKKLKFRKTIR